MNKKILVGILISLILVVIVTAIVFAVKTPPSYTVNGIWSGSFDINGRGNFDFTALYIDGKAVAISQDANVVYHGSVSNKQEVYQSNLVMYIKNKSKFDEVDLSGIFKSHSEIEARFETLEASDEGNLKLSYQKEIYEKPATFDLVRGSWILYHGFTIIKFDIDRSGTVQGADTTGCAYEGRIQPVNSKVNAYRIHLFLSSCNYLNGEMYGLAYLTSSVEENDTLNLHLFDEDSGLFFPIVRNDDTRSMTPMKEPSQTL